MVTASPAPMKASSQAITALILGIIGILPCCNILAPIAWYLGNKEVKAIRAGVSSPAGQGMATAGMILGIIGTIFLVLGFIWAFFMGGMAVLSGMAEATRQ